MANERPKVSALIVADFTDAAPNRLRKKIDKNPTLAEAYTWSHAGGVWTIETGSETVTLQPNSGVLSNADQISCSCLLSPKCLHILASITSLELGEATASAPKEDAEDIESAPEAEPQASLKLSDPQLAAAKDLLEAASALLDAGAVNARLTIVAEILRGVHSCRSVGLHRAAAAGLRICQSVQALRENSAGFHLERLCQEVLELTHVCTVLVSSENVELENLEAWVGVARRKYRDIGNMKLYGVFCEPIVAKTGYAGVVAYFVQSSGESWTLSDVMPGDESRVLGAYKGGVAIGDVTESPRKLSRSGLLLQSATGSDDGRLGSGKQVKAVSSSGVNWDSEDLRGLWEVPYGEQLDRAANALDKPEFQQRPLDDFVFFRGQVVGGNEDALILVSEGVAIQCKATLPHKALPYQENMRLLARAPGLGLRVIARVLYGRPNEVQLLAVSPWTDEESDAPVLTLPEDWNGRCNLGLDKLKRDFFSDALVQPHDVELQERETPDPLARMKRRIEQVAFGGRPTLRVAVLKALNQECAQLENRMMKAGAGALSRLGEAAQHNKRTLTGEVVRGPSDELGRAWLAAALYERAARRAIWRQSGGS